MHNREEIVTLHLAKIAKEKNYPQNSKYGEDHNEINFIAVAPTYYKLITWIFSENNKVDCSVFAERAKKEELSIQIEWLEFWYNLLKDCPLKSYFIYELLKWFRNNDICFSINKNVKDCEKEESNEIKKMFNLIKKI